MHYQRAFAFASVVVAAAAGSQFGCSLVLDLQDRAEMENSTGTNMGTGTGMGTSTDGGGTPVDCVPGWH